VQFINIFTQKDSRFPESGSEITPESHYQENAGSQNAPETGPRIVIPGNRMEIAPGSWDSGKRTFSSICILFNFFNQK